MKLLVTGGCGFLGSNIVSFFLKKEAEIFIIDNLSRKGSRENLEWLKKQAKNSQLKFIRCDISDEKSIDNIFKKYAPFSYICHVAGQVAMTTSIENPFLDFSTNLIGTFNILEKTRKYSANSLIAYSSTNKVYGDLDWIKKEEENNRYFLPEYPNGLDENLPLDFSTPYGCSKGGADQYVRDWARVYGLKTVVFRHSSIYGGRQYASYEQGWIGWFISQILNQYHQSKVKNEINEFTISGNGKQVRDVLHANDLVTLYESAFKNRNILNGEIFNIGGGLKNSLSILELISYIKEIQNINYVFYTNIERRKSDQDYFCADINKAKRLLNWEPNISKEEGLNMMIEWINYSNKKIMNL